MSNAATTQSPSEILYKRILVAMLAKLHNESRSEKKEYNFQYKTKHKDRLKKIRDERRRLNPEYDRLVAKRWHKLHPEVAALKNKQWRSRPESKSKIAACRAKTYQKHKAKIKAAAYAWYCAKCKSDPVFRMVKSFRTRIQKRVKKPNRLPMWDLLGCDSPTLRLHIASQFTAGMIWDNYGHGDGKWVIDHIRPIASFDMGNIADQKVCWNYSNMQPLWWSDNAKKHANV